MPSAKRSPINYSPSFGGGIFRSKSEIDGDLALLDREPVDDLVPESLPMTSPDNVPTTGESSANERTNERPMKTNTSSKRAQMKPNERTNERSLAPTSDAVSSSAPSASAKSDRSNERTFERERVRHSFDIYRDQLVSLGDIQMTRHRQTGRKPKLGDLVQEALDAFIDHHERSHERTNERSR